MEEEVLTGMSDLEAPDEEEQAWRVLQLKGASDKPVLGGQHPAAAEIKHLRGLRGAHLDLMRGIPRFRNRVAFDISGDAATITGDKGQQHPCPYHTDYGVYNFRMHALLLLSGLLDDAERTWREFVPRTFPITPDEVVPLRAPYALAALRKAFPGQWLAAAGPAHV
jgi:hypothetical protein